MSTAATRQTADERREAVYEAAAHEFAQKGFHGASTDEIAGVYDAAARTLQIYVNGALNNGTLSGVVPAGQFDSSFNVNIAQRTGFPGTFNFQGEIDEVHVFNRALTAAEVQSDMNLPR